MGGNNQSHVKKGDVVIFDIDNPDVLNKMRECYGEKFPEIIELTTIPGVIVFQIWDVSAVELPSGKHCQIKTSFLKKFSDSQFGEKGKMFQAVRSGDIDTVRCLISSLGSNVICNNTSCLILAAREGHSNIVKLLVENNVDIDFKNAEGDTALHCAVRENRLEICQLLVDHGASINIKNNSQLTPVMMAVKLRLKNTFNIIIGQNNADLNLRDTDNNTVLHLAVQTSQFKIAKVLFRNGADIMTFNKDGNTAVHLATMTGNHEMLELLLTTKDVGVLDIQNSDKLTALHIAASNNQVDCLKLLIDCNANQNIQNTNLQTPLHVAATEGNLECLKILVDAGAELNVQDKDGNTALHEAVRLYSIVQQTNEEDSQNCPKKSKVSSKTSITVEEIILYMVDKGCLLNIENKINETPESLCLMTLRIKMLARQKCKSMPCKLCNEIVENEIFPCGHASCQNCARQLTECHICQTILQK